MIIGIIGKVGSGKSAATRYIAEEYNAKVFSCDEVAKEMIEKHEVDYEIGDPSEFFKSSDLQEQIRTILHPKVFLRISENIKNIQEQDKTNENIYLIETALPNEYFVDFCDKIICIENTFEKKVELLSEHRGYTESQTKLIYDSQSYYDKFYKEADYVVENNTDKEDLHKKLKEVMDEICIVRK